MGQQSLFALFDTASMSETETSATGTFAPRQTLDLSQTLGASQYTVVDLETTGLTAKRHSITEVTAICYDATGQELSKYSTLVRPEQMPIPEDMVRYTGITNEMVADAPALVQVLRELLDFAGGAPVVVGHNVAFDIGFLREKFKQYQLPGGLECFDVAHAFCTKALAQKLVPGLPSYHGQMVANACGLHNPNPHRAESDVRMCAGIFFYLLGRLPEKAPQVRTLHDLLTFQGPLKGEK
jgi:DNA polymerase III epsilon subunit family exonuclease